MTKILNILRSQSFSYISNLKVRNKSYYDYLEVTFALSNNRTSRYNKNIFKIEKRIERTYKKLTSFKYFYQTKYVIN